MEVSNMKTQKKKLTAISATYKAKELQHTIAEETGMVMYRIAEAALEAYLAAVREKNV
jgi:cell fate (sporulation/competence/biofilm development) regulator YlbF (YheA/YmcA/DUF963 family)